MLSSAATSVWAKSDPQDRTTPVTHWLPLHQHLDDARGVAQLLVERWLPRQVVERIGQDLPAGAGGVAALAGWLAAVHDVGKASPAFTCQVPVLADRMGRAGLRSHRLVAVLPDRGKVRHELVGHVAVHDWLVDFCDVSSTSAERLAVVIGSHHGVPPEHMQLELVRDSPELAGAGPWSAARVELLERARQQCGGNDWLTEVASRPLSLPSQVLLTGVVIMADWIASSDLFDLEPISELQEPRELDEQHARVGSEHRLEQAWGDLALPGPWRALALGDDLDANFSQRFGMPGASARPVQRGAVQVARSQARPGMIVVEAPMGEGKTEAALLAAEELASRSGAGGCFIALPTQATSDAMFARALHWVRALPQEDLAASMFLAHGKASLNDEFQGLRAGTRFRAVGQDGPGGGAVAHWWFGGRKKGVLASFVVGTVDQVLFAGLKSRHLMLRHLALAGKVVIIDEVHAYDAYMSRYLARVLHWLGQYGVPVVLLSATLPAARRAELLRAYDPESGPAPSTEYPLVSGSHGGGQLAVPAAPRGVRVRLQHLDDDLDTLVALLCDRLRDGGCAVVIRNTVTRVQETAERLQAELGEAAVTINHSRFLSCDRARIDRELLRKFGPPGDGVQRPGLHVVVASQVVEQSLDVDFDLLVTDLAPTDLVLQRTGRLHRHRRERPGPVSEPVCVLVGVEDWTAEPVRALRGARRIYGEHLLLRSAALLGPVCREVVGLPGDISPLVQASYGEAEVCPLSWSEAVEVAQAAEVERTRKRVDAAKTFLLGLVASRSMIGWVSAGVGDVDDDARGAAQVRDGEESLEVVVVQSDGVGGLLVADWIERDAGAQIPLSGPLGRDLSRTLPACTLRLPLALSHPGVIGNVIAALEQTPEVASFREHPLLKGQLVLALDSQRQVVLSHGSAQFRLTYDPTRGLLHDQL